MIKNKMRCSIIAAAALILCLSACFTVPVLAAGAVDPGHSAELTLQYQIDGEAVPDLAVRIFRVADISAEADFTLAGQFSGYSVRVNGIDSDNEWNAAAQTLAGYVDSEGLTADADAAGSNAGSASFKDLKTGLYLVMTDTQDQNGTKITFSPFLVSLPGLDENDEWNYSVNVSPKGEKTVPTEKELTYKVVKQWQGDGNGSSRPDSIDIVIMKNGTKFSRQTLAPENNWSWSWTAKDDGSTWTVSELNVPDGYTVTSETDGTSLILTNTCSVTVPGNPPYTGYDGIRFWPSMLLIAGGCGLIALGIRIRKSDARNA